MTGTISTFVFLTFLNCAFVVIAIRSGTPCDSQFGEGLCILITECKLLPRIKRLGHIATMCGFDSNGPIVCCPKYSHQLQFPKTNHQWSGEMKSPDHDFKDGMQGDDPRFSHTQPDYYHYSSASNSPKYNKHNERFSEWNRDDYPNLSSSSSSTSSSWSNNGRRKSTHDKPYDRQDTSTNRYPSFSGDYFRPQHKPSFEFNSYENNDFRPETTRPNSISENSQQTWNNNNKPFTSNEWPDERPSYHNPSNNRPNFGNSYRPSGFESGNSSPKQEEESGPVWELIKQKSTTLRPQSSFQNGWDRPKRVSQIKCEEYSEIVTNNLRPLPLLPNPDVVPVSIQKCGQEAVALIVGGSDTSVGEFPHMAAIGFQSRGNLNWNCGGTLISDEYILTAAHCTHTNEGQPVRVRLGDWNLQRNDDIQTADYRISKIVVHPQYTKTKKYNDVALLQLSDKVQFKDTIRPACLFDQDEIPVNKSVAIGWGRVETAGFKSDILQKVDLTLINNKKCNELYRSMGSEASLNNGITSNMLCAGEMKGGFDTCLGDSGGPLQFTKRGSKCIYHIVGITSFGKAMCGQSRSPGVYTRVSSFLPWIESIVWPEKS